MMNKFEYAKNRINEDIEELKLVIARITNKELIAKYEYTLYVLEGIMKDISN